MAGNALGADAFAAIGLFAPFLSISTFLASIVNTGTVLNYSCEIGKFNKRRANEFFSQGIYDFTISNDNIVEMAKTVQSHMKQASIPAKTELFAALITEEVLMLIQDKNKDKKKPIHAECTLITQPDGVTMILRDSGVIFDLTDADASVDSFRRYVVSSLMNHQEIKLYLTTTGYNRNEFFFSNHKEQAGQP